MKRILSLVLILILSVGMLTACPSPDEEAYDLENAKSSLAELYPTLLPTKEVPVPSTVNDFNVTKVLPLKDGTYTVVWTTNVDQVKVNDYVPSGEDDIFTAETTSTVDVPSMGDEDLLYTLTATITAPDGKTTTKVEFNLMIPKLECNTHEEYMAAAKDQALMVKGVVVAINSVSLGNKYNHLFLADTSVDGGYYCYKVTQDPATLGVEVGMTVAVSGTMSPYSGMQEIKDGQIVILDETIQTVEPLDITEAFAAGSDLGAYVALPVVIKGVELGAQDMAAETSQYLYFSIGEQQGYVRTYVTDFPAGMLTADDKATIDADHLAHFGWKADVTGILVLYNSAPYLIPMSVTPFANYVEVVKTPAEKVEAEKEGIKLETSYREDATVTLPLVGQYYDDVTISWTSDNDAIVIAEDGTATITVPDTKTVVKLTATIKCGEEVSDTLVVEVTLNKAPITFAEAEELAATAGSNYTAGKYVIAGIITEVKNETYGNVYISDGVNSFYIYGLYDSTGDVRYDALTTKPVVGDYVVVTGVLGQYNGASQMKSGWIISCTSPTSIPSANEIASAKEHNTYTEEKYLVTGVVQADVNTKYGNMYIADAEGNKLYLYGLYDLQSNRYDAMATKPVEGDTVTVLTVLGQYDGTAQGKNATLVAHTPATSDDDGTTGDGTTGDDTTGDDTTEVITTISGALAAADGASVKLTGVVISADTWNTEYGNMSVTIKDADGNTIYVYRLGTQVGLGDTITVTGVVGSYNGSKQIAQGGTATIDVVHGDNHTYTDGKCICGAIDPNAAAKTYTKVTSANDFTSGTYVLVINGYVMTKLDGSWVLVDNTATPTEDTFTSSDIATWTLTVSDSSVTLMDANEVYIAPKGGNNNGISSGEYSWNWSIDENGNVVFAGTGSDTVQLAANTGSENKVRAYKNGTISGNTAGYPTSFTVYKLVEN